ncbi:unnamed protein product [Closterium sp. Yama58-4]|nr:unnamed protein product [Closterium sp. Yama58-4]
MGNAQGRDKGRSSMEGRPVPESGRRLASRLGRSHSNNSMGNSPPDSPSGAARSPLMFTPQIPMAPIPKADELSLGSGFGGYGGDGAGGPGADGEQGVPTLITWTHGGNHVSVDGSWDNWTTRQVLQRAGKDFTIVKMLPPGVYQYKFIVDDVWRYAPDLPAVYDEMGNVNNVLEVQEYVPENLDNVAGFEPPRSPVSSYNDPFPVPEDFAKEPPLLPPHLQLTLLNVPVAGDAPTTLPRPQHVILNHLYVEKATA